MQSTQGGYERLFNRTNGAHLWLSLDPDVVDTEEVQKSLLSIRGVEGITPIMHTVSGTLFLGDDRLSGVLLREWPSEPINVDRPLLLEGRAPTDNEKDVALLYRDIAITHGVQVGDKISVLTENGPYPLTVTGLYISSDICPYINCWPPINYVSKNTLSDLGLIASQTSLRGTYDVGLQLIDSSQPSDTLHSTEVFSFRGRRVSQG